MDILKGKPWTIVAEDCIEAMAKMPEACIDFSVFSPPFPSLYAYTHLAEDIGNSEGFQGEAKLHLGFFFRQLRRIIKPGRVVMVHVMQIPRLRRGGGERGLHDFRGLIIRLAERSGFIYDYDWIVRRNPQAQAIRTRSRELQFAGLESDRARSRGAIPDCLIKFMIPGENKMPITDDSVTRNQWIDWAEAYWTGIRETDTLNVRKGRSESDTKHICPLQLSIIHRLIKLYTNAGEIVFSPFAGIGSEGYEALRLGRRFYGCEIKKEYIQAAKANLQTAKADCAQEMRLF